MRLYLSGPMTGLPKHNYPAFMRWARLLRKANYQVINPAELDDGTPLNWIQCLKRDVTKLFTCTGIATMPGWTKSKGANLEVHIGRELDYPVHSVEHFIKNKKEYNK